MICSLSRFCVHKLFTDLGADTAQLCCRGWRGSESPCTSSAAPHLEVTSSSLTMRLRRAPSQQSSTLTQFQSCWVAPSIAPRHRSLQAQQRCSPGEHMTLLLCSRKCIFGCLPCMDTLCLRAHKRCNTCSVDLERVAAKADRRRSAAYRELSQRSERQGKLSNLAAKMAFAKELMGKGTKRKLKAGAEGCPAAYKWKRERKK